MDDINMDFLTGEGSSLNATGDRLDAIERTELRMEGNRIDDIRHQFSNEYNGYKGQPIP
ncbi:hypothetical protein [Alkalimarinus alittae]|uniref:Uncharacterized protein n=1 Tax=Alkalimarinus alittae TaxID=2961619 RepID=A0ABY6MX48_9ALTE|nr:hypothetical protein [Alkalimarinus alittae]UZE94413.1 hypothetical protein NKI27_09925 [Alkalimarinus alittae]